MNKPVSPNDLVTPKVTTGPIQGSRKIHVTPDAAPDLRVPLREIVLTPAANEAPIPVYDTSGTYTDNYAVIDVEQGLKRARTEWVKERGGVEEYQGREIKAEDNGNVTGKHLARRVTEIAVSFKRAPFTLFRETPVSCTNPNVLTLDKGTSRLAQAPSRA